MIELTSPCMSDSYSRQYVFHRHFIVIDIDVMGLYSHEHSHSHE